jgi:hypothetical protein
VEEYKRLRAEVEIKFSTPSGYIPKQSLKDFERELLERTEHIFNSDNHVAYKNIKVLQKKLTSALTFVPRFERIKYVYQVGYLDSELYYGCFLDFRSRIYATG